MAKNRADLVKWGLQKSEEYLLSAQDNVRAGRCARATVILEPHGVWGGDHEVEVTRKYRLFREMFGSLFYLILIVPPLEYARVRDGYPESYDDVVESNRMADLLFMLKNNRYKQLF